MTRAELNRVVRITLRKLSTEIKLSFEMAIRQYTTELFHLGSVHTPFAFSIVLLCENGFS